MELLQVVSKMNNKQTGKIVWKDKSSTILFGYIIAIFLIVLFTWVFLKLEIDSLEKIVSLLPIFFGILLIYFNFIRRLSAISTEGIFTGNIPSKKLNSFKLDEELFSYWKEIDYIKLKNYEVKVPFGSSKLTFILLKTKSDRLCECVIYDPIGFVQALRKLHKDNLLTKETREKYK